MGLFDIFKKNKGGDGEKKSGAAAKWADACGNKRAQAYDRQEAIQELCKLKSAEAVEALLKRFTFATDPSITDQEEKEAVFEGIVATGKEAIEPVRAFATKAESLTWPMKILKELLPEQELVDELIVWLSKWDTEYAKFIDPKLQILQALEEYKSPKIREAAERFLDDVNEPARYHAVGATIAQKEAESIGPLVKLLLEEESVRVKSKIAEGFVTEGWAVPDDQRDAARKALPHQFGVASDGKLTKR
jgi:hypothetical protein